MNKKEEKVLWITKKKKILNVSLNEDLFVSQVKGPHQWRILYDVYVDWHWHKL